MGGGGMELGLGTQASECAGRISPIFSEKTDNLDITG